MAAMTETAMITELNAYLAKIEALVLSGGPDGTKLHTIEGDVAGNNGQVVFDLPVLFNFTVADYQLYTTGVQLMMRDPEGSTAVIPGWAVLDYKITPDGKLTVINRHTASVHYYARLTRPVANP